MPLSIDDFNEVLREFYSRTELKISSLQRREFCFDKTNRHHAFNSLDDLKEYLDEKPPKVFYHSLARYFDPSRREPFATKKIDPDTHKTWVMEDKGFESIDIGFDIDYDHLPNITSYRNGLEQASDNAKRLHRFLTKDLGISPEVISIRFSGNRGFHMVIDDEDLITMGVEERTNIENFVRGDEVHLSGFMDVSNSKKVWTNPRGQYEYRLYPKGVPGWGGNFTDTFIDMVEEYHEERLSDEDRLDLLRSWIPIKQSVNHSMFKRPKFVSDVKEQIKEPTLLQIHNFLLNQHVLHNLSKDWRLTHWAKSSGMKNAAIQHLIRMVVQQTQLRKGVEADQITKDLKRQLRAMGSLHTTSGLPCIEITYEMLDSVDHLFEHIREALGKDLVEISVKNEVYVYPLDRHVVPGDYTVPRYEAYSILCADLATDSVEKEKATTPTPEEADVAAE